MIKTALLLCYVRIQALLFAPFVSGRDNLPPTLKHFGMECQARCVCCVEHHCFIPTLIAASLLEAAVSKALCVSRGSCEQ